MAADTMCVSLPFPSLSFSRILLPNDHYPQNDFTVPCTASLYTNSGVLRHRCNI